MDMSVSDFYDKLARGGRRLEQDKIGFVNEGYWKGVEGSIEIAQLNLIETLIGFLRKGGTNVLDVGCGRGASSKFLTKYFHANEVTGIDIVERHVEISRLVAPECKFELMSATSLDFPDSSFDNILCIESAYHFLTRSRFLDEAFRTLRPGGRLAASDFFVTSNEHGDLLRTLHQLNSDWPNEAWPSENCLPSTDAYKSELLRIGFEYARIEDSTRYRDAPYRNYCIKKAEMDSDHETLRLLMNEKPIGTYCMVYAMKA